MPPEEARTFVQQLQDKIASSNIEVTHRDVLIRLRSMIEEDLQAERSALPEPLIEGQLAERDAA